MAEQAWHRGRGHGSSYKVWHRRFVRVFLCSKALLSPWQKSCFPSFSLLFLSLQCLCELRRKQPNKKQHSSGSKLHLLGKPWDHHLTSSHLTSRWKFTRMKCCGKYWVVTLWCCRKLASCLFLLQSRAEESRCLAGYQYECQQGWMGTQIAEIERCAGGAQAGNWIVLMSVLSCSGWNTIHVSADKTVHVWLSN